MSFRKLKCIVKRLWVLIISILVTLFGTTVTIIYYTGTTGVTDTRYMRSDQHTVNGKTDYKLLTSQTSSSSYVYATYPGSYKTYWGIKVYRILENGTEIAIASSPVAQVGRTSDGEGIQSATWNCPQTSLSSTDAIQIRVCLKFNSTSDGSWSEKRNFITEQLGASSLDASTWTVYYYTKRYYDFDLDITEAYFYHGTTTYNSRIENFKWTSASQAPTAADPSTNTTIAGAYIEFRMKWTANTGNMDTCIFESNVTGTLANDTLWTGAGTPVAWGNTTKAVPNNIGYTIQWCEYANNTAGLWTKSAYQYLQLTYPAVTVGETVNDTSFQMLDGGGIVLTRHYISLPVLFDNITLNIKTYYGGVVGVIYNGTVASPQTLMCYSDVFQPNVDGFYTVTFIEKTPVSGHIWIGALLSNATRVYAKTSSIYYSRYFYELATIFRPPKYINDLFLSVTQYAWNFTCYANGTIVTIDNLLMGTNETLLGKPCLFYSQWRVYGNLSFNSTFHFYWEENGTTAFTGTLSISGQTAWANYTTNLPLTLWEFGSYSYYHVRISQKGLAWQIRIFTEQGIWMDAFSSVTLNNHTGRPTAYLNLAGSPTLGNYTPLSHHPVNWVYFNLTVQDAEGVDKVLLHYYYANPELYAGWHTVVMSHQDGTNFYYYNLTTFAKTEMTFQVYANDTNGNGGIVYVHGKRHPFPSEYVPDCFDAWWFFVLNSKSQSLYNYQSLYMTQQQYSSLWYYNYSCPHGQRVNGGFTDTGLWHSVKSTNNFEVWCTSRLFFTFDQNVTLSGDINITNIYYHFWWNDADGEIKYGYMMEAGDPMYQPIEEWLIDDKTDVRQVLNTTGMGFQYTLYNLRAELRILSSPITVNTNTIYKLYPIVVDDNNASASENPSIVNTRNASTFIILNVPDNATLQTYDSDGDGRTDYEEMFIDFTDPFCSDSDGGGENDGSEYSSGKNPLQWNDDTPDTVSPMWNTTSGYLGAELLYPIYGDYGVIKFWSAWQDAQAVYNATLVVNFSGYIFKQDIVVKTPIKTQWNRIYNQWFNFTTAVRLSVPCVIQWYVRCYDYSGNYAETPSQTFQYSATTFSVGWNKVHPWQVDVGKTLGQINASFLLNSDDWTFLILEAVNGTQWLFVKGYELNAAITVSSTDEWLWVYATQEWIWSHEY